MNIGAEKIIGIFGKMEQIMMESRMKGSENK